MILALLLGANLAFGIPSEADTILNREGYALGYSEAHEQPLWVTYELTREEVKNKEVHRSSATFQPDPDIPTESAQLSDYRHSGYDRGHMAPAADMRWSVQAMKECFYLSNICPQERSFNAGNWADLESLMRHWADCYGAIWIVTGPIFEVVDCCVAKAPCNDAHAVAHKDNKSARHCEEPQRGDEAIHKTIGANQVTVPTAFYKVVYCPSRTQGIGFILPHKGGLLRGDTPRNDALKRCATSIDAVEARTGLNFFLALGALEEERIESSFNPANWRW